jgi:hypothetical protein
MAEAYHSLTADAQREALEFAAAQSGRPAHLLEKDVWVVSALDALFGSPLGADLVFKGGTSLSKAYDIIRRFSEDVDLTYDIRKLASDLVGDAEDALPTTRSQERRWSEQIRKRLPVWVEETALPTLRDALARNHASAATRAEGDKIFIAYEARGTTSGYVKPEVMLEFGARSTGEPNEERDVACDATQYHQTLIFPTARPRVMRPERTFWEKATAIHVFCLQQRLRGERFARHWHDLVRLDEAGVASLALSDRDIGQAVARHKSMFFAEKDAAKAEIDYVAAVGGGLQLVPDGAARTALSDDYDAMVSDGLLQDDAESFEQLMDACRSIQERANAPAPSAA